MEKDFFNQMPALKIVFDSVDTRPHTHSVLKVIVLKVHLSVYQYIKTENAAHEQERKKPWSPFYRLFSNYSTNTHWIWGVIKKLEPLDNVIHAFSLAQPLCCMGSNTMLYKHGKPTQIKNFWIVLYDHSVFNKSIKRPFCCQSACFTALNFIAITEKSMRSPTGLNVSELNYSQQRLLNRRSVISSLTNFDLSIFSKVTSTLQLWLAVAIQETDTRFSHARYHVLTPHAKFGIDRRRRN